jgi:putative endonuclease
VSGVKRVRRGAWHVYVARCADGSLYTGVARDVAARIAQHDAGRGARYTRGRGPLAVLATVPCFERGEAQRIEARIKRLSRTAKDELVATLGGSRSARTAALLHLRRAASC